MPTTHLTSAQLADFVTTVFQPCATDPIPVELHTILSCLNTLPTDTTYVVYDLEQGDPMPSYLYALSGPTVASWVQGDFGYGDVQLLYTRAGNGMLFSYGGSMVSSAVSLWVVPSGLEGQVA